MATARLALLHLAATTRRIPIVQGIRWSSISTKNENVFVSQTKLSEGGASRVSSRLKVAVSIFLLIFMVIFTLYIHLRFTNKQQ